MHLVQSSITLLFNKILFPDFGCRGKFACVFIELVQIDFLETPIAAHTVVIKGVKMFQNSKMVEYSDLDIMQMIGRAVSIIEKSTVHCPLICAHSRAAHSLVLTAI
jgi:hypothetical protein